VPINVTIDADELKALLAMREHEVDYEQVLEIARTVREQIDWDDLRARTAESPYAQAFFTVVDALGLNGD